MLLLFRLHLHVLHFLLLPPVVRSSSLFHNRPDIRLMRIVGGPDLLGDLVHHFLGTSDRVTNLTYFVMVLVVWSPWPLWVSLVAWVVVMEHNLVFEMVYPGGTVGVVDL
jgi:hypothetical protein